MLDSAWNVFQCKTVAFVCPFCYRFEGVFLLEIKTCESFKGSCMLKPNLVLNFCKLDILKNVFCIPEIGRAHV